MDVLEPSIPWYSSPTFLCGDEEQNQYYRRDSQQGTYYKQDGAKNSAIDGRWGSACIISSCGCRGRYGWGRCRHDRGSWSWRSCGRGTGSGCRGGECDENLGLCAQGSCR